MLHLPGNDQSICFSFKQNQLCKLWFHELISSPFSPLILSTESKYLLLPQSTDLCYTGNIQEKMSSFGGDLLNKRIEDNFLQ